MIKTFSILLLPLLLFSLQATAQTSTFEKGYIVLHADTVHGYIRNVPDLIISKTVEFKTNPDIANSTIYTPQEIDAFSLEGLGVIYRAVKVEIVKGPATGQAKRFAKLLVSGYTNLYKLPIPKEEQSIGLNNQNTFLYVLQKDLDQYTLGLYETLNTGILTTNAQYRAMLRAVFNDCESYEDKLNQLAFNDKSIIGEVKKYNACKAPALQTEVHKYKSQALVKHGVEVSVAKGYRYESPNYTSKGYSAIYFWDIMHTDKSRQLSAKLGLGLMYNEFDNVNVLREEISEQLLYLRLPVAFQINLTDDLNSAFIPFINVGANILVPADFNLGELLPYRSIGAGAYCNRLRCSLNVDNINFTKGTTMFSLAVGMRLD